MDPLPFFVAPPSIPPPTPDMAHERVCTECVTSPAVGNVATETYLMWCALSVLLLLLVYVC